MRASIVLILMFLQLAHGQCPGNGGDGDACKNDADSTTLLQAKLNIHIDDDSSSNSKTQLLQENDFEYKEEAIEGSEEANWCDTWGGGQPPERPGYKVIGNNMCGSGKGIEPDFVQTDYASAEECQAVCDQLQDSDPPCKFLLIYPAFVWNGAGAGAGCRLYSECSNFQQNKCKWWLYEKSPAPTVATPPALPPTPVGEAAPPQPSGCSDSLDVTRGQLHVSTLCLPEKIAGPVHKNVFYNGPSPMSQVADRTSSDIMYFSWAADREWGNQDTNGMDGRIYISKVKIPKGSTPRLEKSTHFDGFVRTGGIDITEDGVVGTLCAKFYPGWLTAWQHPDHAHAGNVDHAPMPLCLCEARSADMNNNGIPWLFGKMFQFEHVKATNQVAGYWGTYPIAGWNEQRSAGYGLLQYSPDHKMWTAWFGANVGHHTGYAIHSFKKDAEILPTNHPRYHFLKNPLPANQVRIKEEFYGNTSSENAKWTTCTKLGEKPECPSMFIDTHVLGTGDHQAGSAWRYSPVLHDLGYMKHTHGEVYMRQRGLSPPKGEFSYRNNRNGWQLDQSYGRVGLVGAFGDVKQEGALRACGRDWIAAVVAADGNACVKIGEDGSFIKRTVIEASHNTKLKSGNSMARIAPLGSSERDAKCGASARFLFGYETSDEKRWLVEVDGDCNVKAGTKQDVTMDTKWPVHQDWSTTVDGAVFWVTSWNTDSTGQIIGYGGLAKGAGQAPPVAAAAKQMSPDAPLYGQTPGAHNKAKITIYYPSPVDGTPSTEPESPTPEATAAPTEAPTPPTESPTQAPTESPTEAPTQSPTEAPTGSPTEAPTESPTEAPTESPTEAPEVTAACRDGDVMVATSTGAEIDAADVGTEYVPWVFYNSDWYPICGHYFWDNNNGATTICKKLGFQTGQMIKKRNTYTKDSMPIGKCDPGQDLMSCTRGGNAWGDLQYRGGWCNAGKGIGVRVRCYGGSDHTSNSCANEASTEPTEAPTVPATELPTEAPSTGDCAWTPCEYNLGSNRDGGQKCVPAGASDQVKCDSDAGDKGKRVAFWNLQKTANDRFDITVNDGNVCAKRIDKMNGGWWFGLQIKCLCGTGCGAR